MTLDVKNAIFIFSPSNPYYLDDSHSDLGK